MGSSQTSPNGDLSIQTGGYFAGVQVSGLSIRPDIDIHDANLFNVEYEIKGTNHNAYENDVIVGFTEEPHSSSAYSFEYSIVDASGATV